ncbi:hypothetical protein [Kitasatospora sp. NPDC050463]|uniref:hypothetical protein n=1 Tax=Kitasatospora sp. NPDC050463 TaxID=3155786 RepID=UPI0033EA91B5
MTTFETPGEARATNSYGLAARAFARLKEAEQGVDGHHLPSLRGVAFAACARLALQASAHCDALIEEYTAGPGQDSVEAENQLAEDYAVAIEFRVVEFEHTAERLMRAFVIFDNELGLEVLAEVALALLDRWQAENSREYKLSIVQEMVTGQPPDEATISLRATEELSLMLQGKYGREAL